MDDGRPWLTLENQQIGLSEKAHAEALAEYWLTSIAVEYGSSVAGRVNAESA